MALHVMPVEEGVPVEITSSSTTMMMDAGTGTVIFEKNADEQRTIVSATKLMTPLLTSETLKDRTLSQEDQATISKAATRRIGSRTLPDTGAVYALEKLLKSTVIASDTDSAYA